jgi:hypothetical protein
MKKLLLTMSSLSVWNTAAMNQEETRLQIRTEDGGAIVRLSENAELAGLTGQSTEQSENLEEIPIDQMSTRQLIPMVNLRELGEPFVTRDFVQIPIHDFVRSDAIIVPVGENYTRQYPLQKALLRYEHNLAAGFSNPVQELYAEVNDIEHANRSGKIVADDEYLDGATRIPHQRRAIGQYEADDANLRAKPLTEIFIVGERGEEVVDPARAREDTEFLAYVRTETPPQTNEIGVPEERADDAQFNYQRTETLEDWRRPDGTIFTNRTEDWARVAKPAPPAPLPPPIQYKTIPVYSRVWEGGWLNRHSEWKHTGSETVPTTCWYGAVWYGHEGDRMETHGGAPY